MIEPPGGALPPNLPVPVDDGAASHLPGLRVPSIPLRSTSGHEINLAATRGTTVVYAYPHTGKPDIPTPPEWDAIPGARGCTPQTCGFRDHHADLRQLRARVYGISTDPTEWQHEAVERLHLPFDLLSDEQRTWSNALRLPTFRFEDRIYLKRLTLVLRNARVEKVFYPVFPPDRNAAEVVAYLQSDRRNRR